MTITAIETRYPRELFRYLEGSGGCNIRESSPGIYVVSGYPLDIQVIESKKLTLTENLWLKGLDNGLNAAEAGIILEESRKKGKGAGLGAYLYTLISANIKTMEEVLEMANGELTFEELVEKAGLTAKWEKRGEARGEARGIVIGEARGETRGVSMGEKNAWQKAIELLKQGYTLEQLEQMRP
jgi:hypothetical protein